MIAFPNMPALTGLVPQNQTGVLRLMDTMRDDAALQLDLALDGLTGKRIRSANVPGAGVTYLSRATNGSDSNPLYRIVGLFVLMKRLGLGRERAQRIIDWLQEIVDQLWPAETEEIGRALETDSALDPKDDHLRFMAANGCEESAVALLEVKRRQHAHTWTVILALRRKLAK